MSEVTKESKTSNIASRMEALNLRKTETEIETKLNSCGNCGIKCSLSCAKCKKTYYCSVACQKTHLKQHKPICFPAKEEIADGVRTRGYGEGSFWVATRDIEEGEKIFRDYPLIIGPGKEDYVPGQQICLGCHDILKDFVIESDPRKCGECGWPLCGKNCSEIQRHLTGECQTLCRIKSNMAMVFGREVALMDVPGAYQTIRAFRILALKELDPIKWEAILNLHVPNVLKHRNVEDTVFESYISDFGVTPEDMYKVFSVERYHHGRPYYSRYFSKAEHVVYDKETRLDIGCLENCMVLEISNGDKKKKYPHGITVIAVNRIKKGERLIISLHFTKKWNGTKPRREILKEFGFTCNCARCSDPTELGTNLSAVKCRKCDTGYLLPIQPLDENSRWNCNSEICSASFPGSDLDKSLDKIQKEADFKLGIISREFNNPGDYGDGTLELKRLDAMETLVNKYGKILSPQHYILMNIVEELVRRYIFNLHNVSMPGSPYCDPGLLSSLQNGLQKYASLFFNVTDIIFPSLCDSQVFAYYYVGMSMFYGAQQDMLTSRSFDAVLECFQRGIDCTRTLDRKLKKLSLFENVNLENGEFFKKSLDDAQDASLRLCHSNPAYASIPAKLA